MHHISKAVIPAAGMGTRFLPATKSQPKEMLPVVDRPVMQYVVEEAVSAGLDDLLIITGRGKRSLEDHFDYSPEIEQSLEESNKTDLLAEMHRIAEMATLHYVRQKKAKNSDYGLGYAILHARQHVENEPFAVMLGDTIMWGPGEACTRQMVEAFEQLGKPIIAVEQVDRDKTGRYGIIDGEEIGPGLFRLRSLIEKPDPAEAPSELAIAGRYILTPDIFDAIESAPRQRDGEIGLTPALNQMAQKGEMYALLFDGKRYDIGNKLDFVLTTIEFALRRDDLAGPVRDYVLALAEELKAGSRR